MDEAPTTDALGIPGLVAAPLERVLVRSRGSRVTRSAWRVAVTSDAGPGSIVLVDVSPGEAWYRGDGLFLGWSQDRLAEAYRALAQSSGGTDDGFELPQLG